MGKNAEKSGEARRDPQDVIHFALGVYDPEGTYSRHAGVVMASVFERVSGEALAHILHDETLTDENRSGLAETAEAFGRGVEFHDVSSVMKVFGEGALEFARQRAVTTGTLFRLLIPDLVKADRAIYLDSDVIVDMDIRELWNVSLGECSVGGVAEGAFKKFSSAGLSMRLVGCDAGKYINAGVLVMDLSRIRDIYNLPEECGRWFEKHGQASLMLDQDFINACFRGDTAFIDGRFNSSRRDRCASGAIIHAVGGSKPWNSAEGSYAESLYWKAFLKTAWGRREGAIVDAMLEAVKNSVWTHRHTTSCYANILKRFKNDVILNDFTRSVLLLIKYIYGRIRNQVTG
jgi:lipopolysaccharide biosynthesis glycosyltransferase